MLRFSTLVCLFLAPAILCAQSNQQQFGLLVKSGTYAEGFKIREVNNFVDNLSINQLKHHRGSAMVFGAYYQFPLGRRLALSTELLYRVGLFSRYNESISQTMESTYVYLQSDRFVQHSISLPLKLLYTPFKHKKLALGVGVGVTKVVNARAIGTMQSTNSASPQFNHTFQYESGTMEMDAFPLALSSLAGMYYPLNKFTSLGLELTAEHQRVNPYAQFYTTVDHDCLCYAYPNVPPVNIRSVALVLRHHLRREH